jgi:putative acetyltransferase
MDAPKAMNISVERADAPGVRELLELSDEFHGALYPPEGTFLLDVSELLSPNVTVVVARDGDRAIGMGALVEKDGYAEIKRMFLRDEARGHGAADGILQSLEGAARSAGVDTLQLETGPLQPAAIAFYERNGFTRIPNFGEYVDSIHSVCYAKRLA